MTELLYWFLVSQTLSGLPAMDPGTEVRVVSPDLLTIHAVGRVVGDALVFSVPLPANAEIRVLVFPPDATETEVAEALSGATALRGKVSPAGDDLWIAFEETEGFLSFRKWLEEERDMSLLVEPDAAP